MSDHMDRLKKQVVNHDEESEKARHLAREYARQENPAFNIFTIIVGLIVCVVIFFMLMALGSILINGKVIFVSFLLLIGTFFIWNMDVNKWQHEDPNRIDPNMTPGDVEESLRNGGGTTDSTFDKTHHSN